MLRPDGRGISGARIQLTDQAGNVRHTQTNPFDYYRFLDVHAGQAYTITLDHKLFHFTGRVLQIDDNIDGLDFVAEEP